MKTVSASDIGTIKMSTNPPQHVVNAGFRVIHNRKVKEWVGIGWVETRDAERDDYKNIPEVIG